MAEKIVMSVSRRDRLLKSGLQLLRYRKGYQKCVFIMGCQRSGTTLITHLFNQIPYSKVFGEYSPLSAQDPGRIRLNPLDDVYHQLSRVHAPLVVCKPLVESHRANELLTKVPRSSILWVYRNFSDVALSLCKKSSRKDGHGDILSIVRDLPGDWRNEGASSAVRKIINRHYHETLSPIDAACLFWYARNQLYFEQSLDSDTSCTLWKYEQLVENPVTVMSDFLEKLQLPLSIKKLEDAVYSSSVGSAMSTNVSSEIQALCMDLQHRLDSAGALES